MKESDYITLIHRELTGVATLDETVLLQDWISASPLNAEHYRQCIRIWNHNSVDQVFTTPDDNDFQLQRNRLRKNLDALRQGARRKRPLLPFPKIAATLLLGFALAFTIWGIVQPVSYNATALQYLALSDSSRVAINTNSTINLRRTPGSIKASFSGQGFFQVNENSKMQVTVDGGEILATGAEFFVSTLKDSLARITVTAGALTLTTRDTSLTIGVGQQVIVKSNNSGLIMKSASLNDYTWFTNTCQFENTTLQKIVALLEEQYQIRIHITDKVLLSEVYSGTFIHENVSTVVNKLSSGIGFVYELRDGIYHIYPATS